MLAKRIIPCLDVMNGRTVKGVQFENIRDAGDPVELASLYSQQGADELVFLDITATSEKRKIFLQLIKRLSREINIPFTVGGGITNLADIHDLLQNGADKVSINSGAFKDPNLIVQAAREFGSQCIVVAIDTRHHENEWIVYLNGGRLPTSENAISWASRAEESGAGEILLTSMDHDGTRDGFAVDLTRELWDSVRIPVIASGGAGTPAHFRDVFLQGHADAALAAGIFHFGEMNIGDLKTYLSKENISIRTSFI